MTRRTAWAISGAVVTAVTAFVLMLGATFGQFGFHGTTRTDAQVAAGVAAPDTSATSDNQVISVSASSSDDDDEGDDEEHDDGDERGDDDENESAYEAEEDD